MSNVWFPGDDVPVGYQQIVGLAASTALTVPTGARRAVIQPEGQGVRYRDDGTAPTAGVGQPLLVGQPLVYTGGRDGLNAIRFIQMAATATLNITYYS